MTTLDLGGAPRVCIWFPLGDLWVDGCTKGENAAWPSPTARGWRFCPKCAARLEVRA